MHIPEELREVSEYIDMELVEGWVRVRCRGLPWHSAHAGGGPTTAARYCDAVERLARENPGCASCEMGGIRLAEAKMLQPVLDV